MAELVSETVKAGKSDSENAAKPLQEEFFREGQNQYVDRLFKAGQEQQLPAGWDKELGDLQKQLERTQKLIKEMKVTCDTGLYDLELSRRSFTGNPYKILTAGSGLAMLPKSPYLAAVPLTGFAALQGYDDFKMLRNQDNLLGRSKYTLGLLSDGAAAAGALGFLSESVPMKYKLPLLLGGLAARAAIDFIPAKKN